MIFIFDRDENMKAVLRRESPESMPYWEAAFVEQLNGDIRLKFHIPADHDDAQYIEEESRVVYRDDDNMERLLVVRETEEKRTSDDRVRKFVYCKDAAIPELNDSPVERISYESATPLQVLNDVLKNSRYQPGIVDSFEPKPFNIEMTNAMQAIQQMIETWGGEIRFRVQVSGNKIAFRYVDFLTRRGRITGKRFEYRKDIQEIIRRVNTKNLKTAIYPLGKSIKNDDGTEEKLTIADVEWSTANGDPVDKPKGQKWIGDPDALEKWGYLNEDGTRSHRFGFWENTEIEDPVVLIQAGWDYLQNSGITEPQVSYELSVLTLEKLSGYEHEAVRLGDTVYVIDRGFKKPIEIEARVIEIERDLDKPKNSRIVLGNFVETFIQSVDQVRQDVEKRIRPIERINYLNSIIDLENNLIESSRGYVYIDDPNGIMIYNKLRDENPTQAMQLNSAGFRIAGSKDPNTGDFNWQTFGTFNGFTASLINTGTLNANLVEIISTDISTGTSRKVEMYDGNIYTYYYGELTMALTGYSLDFFDHGNFSDGSNKGNITGKVELAWSSKTGDPSGEYNARGVAVVTLHDLLGLGKTTPDDEFSFHEFAFYWNKGQNRAYLSGPGSGGDYNKFWSLTLTPDHDMWNTDFRHGPSMRLAIGDINGSHYSGVYFSIGDKEHGGDGRYFEVWEHRDTSGTRYPALQMNEERLFLHRDYLHFRKPGTTGTNRGWIYTTDNIIALSKEEGFAIILDRSSKTMYFVIDGQTKFWIDTNGGHSI
mgnify:CR=1 FL=1